MKLFIPLATLVLTLFVTACGKKAQIEEPLQQEKSSPSVDELNFNAFRILRKAVSDNNVSEVKRIIKENPSLDLNQILTDTGETFLTLSIKNDFRDIRNFLIERGVLLENANVNKETPLIVAVAENRLNSIKVLLDQKVDLERRNSAGDTALLVALKRRNDEVALLLLRHGANVNASDRNEKNALKIALEYDLTGSIEFIKGIMDLEFGAPDVAAFRHILQTADHKRLSSVLVRYPRVATENVYQSINPLAILVEGKDQKSAIRSAELLLRYDANVNGPEGAEETPLIKATMSRKKSFADLFLSSSANPQLVDKDGKSALIHAVELNNPELVELLLRYSAVEKYTYRKNGKKITYNACEIVKNKAKVLKTEEEKSANLKIKIALDCSLFSLLF